MAELLEKTKSSYFLAFKNVFREVISGKLILQIEKFFPKCVSVYCFTLRLETYIYCFFL